MAVRFIGVDDAGKITGTLAKPAVEAIAKPLVDAAEARLTPKPILKTTPLAATKANGSADGPTNLMIRIVVNVKPVATRWRVRIRNAGATAQGSGTLSSVGIYHGPTATNPALVSGVSIPRVVPDFTITGTTEYVSPWVSGATYPLGGSKNYSIGFNFTGATTTVMGDATLPIYTAPGSNNAGSTIVTPTLATRVPLAITVEYEAEYAQGAVAQGGIMQVTPEEYLAAKNAGTLDSGIFYAVTELA